MSKRPTKIKIFDIARNSRGEMAIFYNHKGKIPNNSHVEIDDKNNTLFIHRIDMKETVQLLDVVSEDLERIRSLDKILINEVTPNDEVVSFFSKII